MWWSMMNPTLTAQGHTHVRSQGSAAKGKAAFSPEVCREEGPASPLANPCASTCRVAQLSLSLIGGLVSRNSPWAVAQECGRAISRVRTVDSQHVNTPHGWSHAFQHGLQTNKVEVIGLAEPEKKMVAALSIGCPPPPLATMIKAW